MQWICLNTCCSSTQFSFPKIFVICAVAAGRCAAAAIANLYDATI